jgi:hypothetical protein
MVPFLNPNSPAEEHYNRSLCRTRVLIEQTFGILKRRFQLLQGPIRTQPQRAVTYVSACVVLHNFGIENGDIIGVDDIEVEPYVHQGVVEGGDGNNQRQHIVMTYFN